MANSARVVIKLCAVALGAAALLGVGASEASPASGSSTVTISMLANTIDQPGYDVLIRNFERVYPNIKVNASYATNNVLYQLETTELAAGNAPDLLATTLGCGGTPLSMCSFAKSGYLTPLVKEPWTRRSIPLVTSLAKQGQLLFAFEPEVGMEGMFTNNDLFRKLGFKVPQTFSQFLDLCRKARTAGTVAFMLAGASPPTMAYLLTDLAVPTVYAKDKLWAQKLKGGKVSFDGSSGWHKALQELLDMNNANCFEPGVTGTTTAGAQAQFAQGQGLMIPGLTSQMGQIAADNPQFTLSAHPFPGGSEPTQTRAFLNLDPAVSVNAHASLQNQAAARSFIDFVARPKQNALFAQVQGGLTQYQFLKEQLPTFLLDYASVFKERKYVVNPISGWWNPNVFLTLEQDGVGLLTGQLSVDDVLSAMDAAWKKGPA